MFSEMFDEKEWRTERQCHSNRDHVRAIVTPEFDGCAKTEFTLVDKRSYDKNLT
jgi:hypothetical protein